MNPPVVTVRNLVVAYIRVPHGPRRTAILTALRLYANDRTKAAAFNLARGIEVDSKQFPSLGRVDPEHPSHGFFDALFGAAGTAKHADLAVFTE